jgi:hypothetical protein
LVKDKKQHQRYTGPNENDLFLAIVPDDRYIVLDDWIAIEKLMSPAPDEYSGKQKDDHSDTESDKQRRNSLLFNQRYHQRIVRFHARALLPTAVQSPLRRVQDFPMQSPLGG